MIINQVNNEQISNFQENGFLILEKFLPDKILQALKIKIEPLFRGDFETGIEPDEWNWKYEKDDPNDTRQICNAWKSDNLIRETVCNESIGRIISQLMGWEGVRLIQDNVLWKPPGAGPVTFHQDASYDDWIIPQTMATCWIALDDTFIDSGTLEFAVGSHNWGLSEPPNDFIGDNNHEIYLQKHAKKLGKTIEIAKVLVPAGGASFHHGFLWHGSKSNSTKKERRALVSHCVPETATFHETNCGGTGKVYRKYKLNDSYELEDSFFPVIWNQQKN